IPAVQATASSEPEASIPVSQNGADSGRTRQTLAVGQRCDSKVTKAVEPVRGTYPNATFTIYKEPIDRIPREPVRLCECVVASLVHVHKTLVTRSDPETAVAIAKYPFGPEWPSKT